MRFLRILLIAFLLTGCEDEQSDTTPPTVSISSPVSGQTVFEIVTISVTTQDNEGVARVQFIVNDSLEMTDSESPFQYDWNTTQYINGSEHVVKAVSYDTSDNYTESQPILLIVDNTNASPEPVDVLSVDYDFEYMTVIWEESTASDFSSYKLLHAEQEESDRDTVVTLSDISTTTHQISDFDPTHTNYFWVMVSDTLGLYSVGESLSNQIDEPPSEPVLYPIVYEDGHFQITWSQNHDDDFESYRLYESESPSMGGRVLIQTTSERADTSFSQPISANEVRYYSVYTRDFWGLTEESETQQGNSFEIFMRTFGGDEDEVGRSVQQTSDGGYIVTGYTDSFSDGPRDLWLVKIDPNGNEEWNQMYDEGYGEAGYSVEQSLDGGFIITGSKGGDVWLVKSDSGGEEEWNQSFYGESSDCGQSVQQTADGGYVVSGYTNSYGSGGSDVLLMKTDVDGNSEWMQTFGGSDYDVGRSVQQTMDGGYIITGTTESFGVSEEDVWLIKTDSEGDEEWNQTFDNGQTDRGYSGAQTSDGGYIITGWSWTGTPDVWLIKTDASGNEEWNRVFGDNLTHAGGNSVQQTTDGGYIVTGTGPIEGNIWLIKTDPAGNEEWSQSFSEGTWDNGYSVQQTTDGGYVVVGYIDVYSGNTDLMIIKTDPFGTTVPFE